MALSKLVAFPARPQQTYVGNDRRGAPAPALARDRHELTAALGGAYLLWGATVAAVTFGYTMPAHFDTPALVNVVDATTVVAGAVAALLTFVRWRLTGETRPLWIGGAALCLGPAAAFGGTLLPSAIGFAQGAPAIRVAARLVGIACLSGAVLWPEIDTRMRPGRVAAGVLGLTGLLAASLALSPFSGVSATLAVPVTFTAGWAVVALVGYRAYKRNIESHMLSVAVAAAVFALGETVWVAARAGGDPLMTLAGATSLQAAALVVLLVRGLRDLETAFCVQRERLLESEISIEIERVRERTREALDSARVHDAHNALMALEGATLILDRARKGAGLDRAEAMIDALGSEVANLRTLVRTEVPDRFAPLSLSDLIAEALDGADVPSVEVLVDEDEALVALGRQADSVATVAQLLENAGQHAPGLPITVRAELDGDWVSLYVEDRGPGVGKRERQTIFERRTDDSESADDRSLGNLSLFAARRLMQDQGGDLWVQARPGGGASFGVCWPSASRAQFADVRTTDQERADVNEHTNDRKVTA